MTTYPNVPADPASTDAVPPATIAATLDIVRLLVGDVTALTGAAALAGSTAPTLTVPATLSVAPSVAVAIVGITFADPGNTSASVYTYGIQNSTGTLTANSAAGVTVPGSGTAILSGVGPIAAVQSALASLSYTPGTVGLDALTFTVSRNGIVLMQSISVLITAAAQGGTGGVVTIAHPTATQAIKANTPLVIAGLSVSDTAAASGAGSLVVTASGAGNGVLAMTAGGALLSGSGTSSITYAATITQANAALATLTLTGYTAGAIQVSFAYTDNLGNVSSIATVPATVTGTVSPLPASTTATGNPGLSLPSLQIAPGQTYKFTRINWVDTVGAGNAGNSTANFYMANSTQGTISATVPGGYTLYNGALNSGNFQLNAVWAVNQAFVQSLTYTAPAAAGSYTLNVNLASGFGQVENGTIAITVAVGAATVETGGYTPYTVVGGGGTAVAGIPGDATGITAMRATDLMGRFGVNVFPYTGGGDGGDESFTNSTGLQACVSYICAGSGHGMILRGYVADTNYETFYQTMNTALGTSTLACINHYGSTNPPSAGVIGDMTAAKSNGYLGPYGYAEGVNEPDTAIFTSMTGAQTLPIQQALWNGVHSAGIKVGSASIVGSYGPGSFSQSGQNYYTALLQNFWGSNLSAAIAASDYLSTHYYNGHGIGNGNNVLYQWSKAPSTVAYQSQPVGITEYHPALYNTTGPIYAGQNAVNSLAYGAYYCACDFISAVMDMGCISFIWFCMYNYNYNFPNTSTFIPIGLFGGATAPGGNATMPNPVATMLKAFYALMADTGSNRFTFTPGKLNVTVTGLPPGDGTSSYLGGQVYVLQCSDGSYRVIVLNAATTLALGTTSAITVNFGSTVTSVIDYSLTNPVTASPTAIQSRTNVASLAMNLSTEVRILKVVHA